MSTTDFRSAPSLVSRRMFEQVHEPRFIVHDCVVAT